jgi:hypothetical protein
MGAPIKKDTVVSEYASAMAIAVRVNPNGRLPLSFPRTLKFEDGMGGVTTQTALAGLFGHYGTINMTDLVADGTLGLEITEGGKKDVINIPVIAGDFVAPAAATQAEIVLVLNKAITGLGVTGNFPNIGHGFTASVDATGRLKIVGAGVEPALRPLIFMINDTYNAGTGLLESNAATVLGLNIPYSRAIKNMASLTAAQNSTAAATKENQDGEKTVTSITIPQDVTGHTLSLEDAQRHPMTRVVLTGGYFDEASGEYTPKPTSVASPRFALFCFARLFDEGTSVKEGQFAFALDIYPSCTAVRNNGDKASQDFNHDKYDISASDGPEIPAGTTIYITNEEYEQFVAAFA